MRQSASAKRFGSAAVEMAVVSPLLVLLLTGMWEFGRMVEMRQILDNAAREGARYASGGNVTPAQVQTVVTNYLTAADVPTTGVTVYVYNITLNANPAAGSASDSPATASQMDRLRVSVTLPFNNYRWIVMNQFASNVSLTATAEWACMKDQPLVVDAAMPIN